jgi:DNA-binding NarL/FixJ family response regulator
MRIVIADPSTLLRSVIVGVYSDAADVEVAATAASLGELRACCRRDKPHVVLAATSFPDGSLADAIADVLLIGARVLVVCDAQATESAARLLFAGASGCLFVQDAGPVDVVEATRAVAAGNAALHPAVAAAVLQQWRSSQGRTAEDARNSPMAPDAEAPRLTPREAEVLRALVRGLPTKTIGREMSVSPKTVEAHIGRLLAKLKARHRAHAVSIASDLGLLQAKNCETGKCEESRW